MREGKLSNETLKKVIIDNISKINDAVLVGPNVGEDCSVIQFGDEVCVITTDPITAAQDNIGEIGVHICCNDIASAGVRPLGILVTILAPVNTTIEAIGGVMREITDTCRELSVDILGGHTEITSSVNRMILSITAIGKGGKKDFVTTGGAIAGDEIVVTGYAGTEGTAILANEYQDYLKGRLDEETVNRGKELLKGISVVKAGTLSAQFGVSAMHDATEGGILGAIWELAEASGKGAYIYEDRIPVKEETVKICRALDINPFKLISSGCMVIACRDGKGLCKLLGENGISAAVAGKITERGIIIHSAGGDTIVDPPESDEIYNVKIN